LIRFFFILAILTCCCFSLFSSKKIDDHLVARTKKNSSRFVEKKIRYDVKMRMS